MCKDVIGESYTAERENEVNTSLGAGLTTQLLHLVGAYFKRAVEHDADDTFGTINFTILNSRLKEQQSMKSWAYLSKTI